MQSWLKGAYLKKQVQAYALHSVFYFGFFYIQNGIYVKFALLA